MAHPMLATLWLLNTVLFCAYPGIFLYLLIRQIRAPKNVKWYGWLFTIGSLTTGALVVIDRMNGLRHHRYLMGDMGFVAALANLILVFGFLIWSNANRITARRAA
jgi:uncharacterized membrane-anchored protein